MIVYDLRCACGFQFEGWFRDRLDQEEQQAKGGIECPLCGCREVSRILSPVASVRLGGDSDETAAPSTPEVSGMSDEAKALAFLRGLQRYVQGHFENVGPRLAEEALKIHYGVNPARNLRGVATEQEEMILEQEGIELVKIPLLPDEPEDVQ